MPSKLIVGAGVILDIAWAAWTQARPRLDIGRHQVMQRPDYSFDLDFLEKYSPAKTSIFAAFDNRFLNFKRLELMSLIRSRAFRMEPFVSPRASVGTGARIDDNAFIGDGAVIGAGAIVHDSAFIGERAVVGHGAEIGQGAWIEPGAVVGRRARIGSHTTIGLGVPVPDGVEVGSLCVLDVPNVYRANVPARTFYNPIFHEPIRVFN